MEPKKLKSGKQKSKKKRICSLESASRHSGESVEPVQKKKRRLRWKGFVEIGFEPGMKGVMDDESGDSMEPTGEMLSPFVYE